MPPERIYKNEFNGINVYVSLKTMIIQPMMTYKTVVIIFVGTLLKLKKLRVIPIIKHINSIIITMIIEVLENDRATTGKYVPKIRKYIVS